MNTKELHAAIRTAVNQAAGRLCYQFRYLVADDARSQGWLIALEAVDQFDPDKVGESGAVGWFGKIVSRELRRWARDNHPLKQFTRGHRAARCLGVRIGGQDLPGEELHGDYTHSSSGDGGAMCTAGFRHETREFAAGAITRHPYEDASEEDREWSARAAAALEVLCEEYPDLLGIDGTTPLSKSETQRLNHLRRRAAKIAELASQPSLMLKAFDHDHGTA